MIDGLAQLARDACRDANGGAQGFARCTEHLAGQEGNKVPTSPIDLFLQALVARQTRLNAELRTANPHSRMLIKTERAELESIMATFRRLVMAAPEPVPAETVVRSAAAVISSQSEAVQREPAEFKLSGDGEAAVDLGIRIVRAVLADRRSTLSDILGAARALRALQRMPRSTPGTDCEINVNYRFGDSDFSEYRYVGFRIREESFEINTGGSVYDKAVGGDSYVGESWLMEIDDNGRRSGDIAAFAREVDELISLGASFQVGDESEGELEA